MISICCALSRGILQPETCDQHVPRSDLIPTPPEERLPDGRTWWIVVRHLVHLVRADVMSLHDVLATHALGGILWTLYSIVCSPTVLASVQWMPFHFLHQISLPYT